MSQTNPPNQTLYVRNLNDKINKQDLRLSLYTLFTTYGVVIDVVASKTIKNRGQAFIAFRDVPSATRAMRALEGFSIFGREMVIIFIFIFWPSPSPASSHRQYNKLMLWGKPRATQKIAYAKTKSHKIAKYDGTFRMPGTAGAASAAALGEGAEGKPFVPLPGATATATAPAPAAAAGLVGAAASPAADAVAGQKRLREEDSGTSCVPLAGVRELTDGSVDDGEEAEMEMEDDDD
jgi:U2 small nuclear ribonucleoprotein B''